MHTRLAIALVLLLGLVFSLAGSTAFAQDGQFTDLSAQSATPLTNAFTYQGQLMRLGSPYNGTCSFQFSLWDSATGGVQIGSTQGPTSLPVSTGVFTAALNDTGKFGANPFNGDNRWLQVEVNCPGDLPNQYTTLLRTQLTATPYASYALNSANSGKLAGFQPAQLENLTRANPPQSTTLTALASGGGQHSSITIAKDGMPFISYVDQAASQLKIAHCYDVACSQTTPTLMNVYTANHPTDSTSIAIGSDGFPIISFYDQTSHDIVVVHCTSWDCDWVAPTIIDTISNNAPSGTSIAIGGDGLPILSYSDNSLGRLKIVHCSNVACGSWSTLLLTAAGGGMGSSIAVGYDGQAIISYYDQTKIQVAHCNNPACDSATITSVATLGYSGANRTSIAIGADGLPILTYQDTVSTGGPYPLRLVHCTDRMCQNPGPIQTVDSNRSFDSSITIGSDGLPIISYAMHSTNDELRVVHCSDVACTQLQAYIETQRLDIDNTGHGFQHTAITIGTDGLPIISYYDAANGALKVAHCSNVFCAPYFRRR